MPLSFAFIWTGGVSLRLRASNEGLLRPRFFEPIAIQLRVVIEAVHLRAWAEHIPIVRGLRATGWPHDHPLPSPLYS